MYETDTDLDTNRAGRFGGVPVPAAPRPYRLSDRLKNAAQDGIVWGVKIALAVGLVVVAVSYLLGDYSQTRTRAIKGEQAFTYIQQTLAAQQAAQKAAPAAKPPSP